MSDDTPRDPVTGEWAYDAVELPLILDKTTQPWNVCHAPCVECAVKDGAEHTLEDCGLYP